MTDVLDSPENKANRLIKLRNLTKLARKDMAQMASVSVLTYKGWENGRFGGIPERRAVILLEALQIEGIKGSVDWLIYGIGDPPKKILSHQNEQLNTVLNSTEEYSPEVMEQLHIKAELEFFCNNNNWEVLSLTVPDDAMNPCFLAGDMVAGIKLPQDKFDQAIGINCIVRTKNNKIILRQIQKGSTAGSFTLLCLDISNQKQPITYNVELSDIAPVSWLRRKSILFS